jgi:hypothetical protein
VLELPPMLYHELPADVPVSLPYQELPQTTAPAPVSASIDIASATSVRRDLFMEE